MKDPESVGEIGVSALNKASWRLLPLLGACFVVAYMDRVNISFAAAQMNRDLDFSATIYGVGAGLFFLSYALFEVPSNLLLVRFGARRWIARIMLSWGLIASSMMFVRTPLQFYVLRFALGIAEAGFFPGVIYYLSQWYPAAHRARAVGRFYLALPLSTAIMGAVAGSLLALQGRLGLAGWQWMFLIEGAPSLVMGLAVLRWLPDTPAKASWLTDPERRWITRTLSAESAKPEGHRSGDLLWSLRQPLVLKLGFFFFLVLGANTAFTFSAPILLQQATRMSAGQVGYLISAGNLLAVLATLINCWSSDRCGERYLHMILPLALLAAASFVWFAFPRPLIVVGAYFVAMIAYYAMITLVWPLASRGIAPGAAAVSFAAINSIGQLGSFISPFAWGWAKDVTGSYQLGLGVLPIPFVLGAGVVAQLWFQSRGVRAVFSSHALES